jgi:hypothetical protein
VESSRRGTAPAGLKVEFGSCVSAYRGPSRPERSDDAVHLRYPNVSGSLAIGGGLIFIGLTDGTVAAYDDVTLDELWRTNDGSSFNAPPMTFEVNGKQYVAIAIGLYATGKPLPHRGGQDAGAGERDHALRQVHLHRVRKVCGRTSVTRPCCTCSVPGGSRPTGYPVTQASEVTVDKERRDGTAHASPTLT